MRRQERNMKRLLPLAAVVLTCAAGSAFAATALLPPIPRGTIALHLDPIATGMSAPDYGISPPGDPTRLFVLEQNGLVRLIQNGVLQSGSALDLQSRVQIAPVGTGPLNPGNANDERGLL